MDRYLRGLMDPFVTLLEVHKLMYFLQASGQQLRLDYKKGPYGPYAENLRHVLKRVEGHFISGYHDGGDDPTKELHLVPQALEDAKRFLEGDPVQQNLSRVETLVEGFETSFGLELLATVHWVSVQEGAGDPEQVVEQVHAWNERKRQFTPRQVRIALDRLREQGWLTEVPA
ncbi:MAG: hypothetical protein WBA12_13450 [Catalinimonas sp.]